MDKIYSAVNEVVLENKNWKCVSRSEFTLGSKTKEIPKSSNLYKGSTASFKLTLFLDSILTLSLEIGISN